MSATCPERRSRAQSAAGLSSLQYTLSAGNVSRWQVSMGNFYTMGKSLVSGKKCLGNGNRIKPYVNSIIVTRNEELCGDGILSLVLYINIPQWQVMKFQKIGRSSFLIVVIGQ